MHIKMEVEMCQTIIKHTMQYGYKYRAMIKTKEHLLNMTEDRMIRWIQRFSVNGYKRVSRFEREQKLG